MLCRITQTDCSPVKNAAISKASPLKQLRSEYATFTLPFRLCVSQPGFAVKNHARLLHLRPLQRHKASARRGHVPTRLLDAAPFCHPLRGHLQKRVPAVIPRQCPSHLDIEQQNSALTSDFSCSQCL